MRLDGMRFAAVNAVGVAYCAQEPDNERSHYGRPRRLLPNLQVVRVLDAAGAGPRAGAKPNLAGQFAQTDYELVNIAHYQCRRYPPQVFGEATVQPAGFWRQAFPGMQATEWCGEYAAREEA